jgi:hypothetical protein
MRGTISPLPQYAFMTWCLVKHRNNFTFNLYLLRCATGWMIGGSRPESSSGAHPASYPMGNRSSFHGDKDAGVWPLTSIQCRGQECVELYLHSPNKTLWRGAQLKHKDNFTFTFTCCGTAFSPIITFFWVFSAFWNFRPFNSDFISGKSQKSFGAKSGEQGGCSV